MNPRQPAPGRTPGRRWQFHQAPTKKSLGDAVGVSPVRLPKMNLHRRPRAEDSDPMPADALKCKECSTEYPLEARFVCERCFGPLEVSYSLPDSDPAALKRRIQAGPHNIWRYADFLPLQGPARSALPTGWTPLVKADRLAERLGLGELYIKNEAATPRPPLKARALPAARARALGPGFDPLACAPPGTPATAAGAPAAAAGLPAYVLIPHDLEEQ